MPPSSQNRHASRSLAHQRDMRFGRHKQRCDREVAVDMLPCADAAPEWPALLAATTTATLILRADLSYRHSSTAAVCDTYCGT